MVKPHRDVRAFAGAALTGLAAALALVGCVETSGDDIALPSEAYGVQGAVLLHAPTSDELWTVDWKGDAPRIRTAAWDANVGPSLLASDGAKLVLDTTKRALHRLTSDGKEPSQWPLGAPFSAIAGCDDGGAAIAFHVDGAATKQLVNTAEIGLVDLSNPGSKVIRATATGLARAPLAARCSAKVQLPDGDHRLVWLLVPSALGLIDIGPAGATTVVVPLAAPGASVVVTPSRTVATVDAGGVDLYLIANGSSDVIHLRVQLGGAAPQVSLDQIAVGKGPRELEVFMSSDGLRAATLDVDVHSVSLINPATGTGIAVALVDFLATWQTFDDVDGHRWALASSPSLQWLTLIDLDRLEKKKGKAIQRLKLELPATAVEIVGGHAIVRHGSSSVVSVVDLASGKVSFFQGTGIVTQTLTRGDSVYLLADSTAQWSQVSSISRIRLSDLTGETLQLGRRVTALLPLGTDGVAVVGAGFAGPAVGLWPAGVPGAGHWLEGFALDGALNREVP